MKELAGLAKEGKLQPQQYQGGTASLSNMGMYGIKNFEAVINPPQAMIMAIGAGEKRPYVINDSLQIATVMSATGSFDHRAIDGADGARLMQAFKRLVENPLALRLLEGEFEEGDTVVVDRDPAGAQLVFRTAGRDAGAEAPSGSRETAAV